MTEEEEKQFEILCDAINAGKVPVVDVTPPEIKKNMSKELRESTKNIWYVKDKSISLRVSDHILELVKQKAQKQGIPYQTLIGSWIHQHAMEE
jgi:predicted small secreted protein